MTEEQMNQSYTKLYALYMQNLAKTGNAPKYPVPSPEEFTAASWEGKKGGKTINLLNLESNRLRKSSIKVNDHIFSWMMIIVFYFFIYKAR